MFRDDLFGGGLERNVKLVGLLDMNEEYEIQRASLAKLKRARNILEAIYAEGKYGALTQKAICDKIYIQGGEDNRLLVIQSGEAQLAYEEMKEAGRILEGKVNLMGKQPTIL